MLLKYTCTNPFEGQRTIHRCLSSSSLCVTQSPNAGSLLFNAFKTAFDRPSYHAAAWSRALMPPPYASLSNGHRHRTSCSLSLLDLPHLAHLSPLTLDRAASSVPTLGCRHLHDHASLLDGTTSLFSPNASLGRRHLHGHSSRLGNAAALPLCRQRLHLRHLFLFLDDAATLPQTLDLDINASHRHTALSSKCFNPAGQHVSTATPSRRQHHRFNLQQT